MPRSGTPSSLSNIQSPAVLGFRDFLDLVLAEFERSLIRERTQAGLAAARVRGRMGGRPKRLDPVKLALALRLHQEEKRTIKEICQMMGISKSTPCKYLAKADSDAVRTRKQIPCDSSI